MAESGFQVRETERIPGLKQPARFNAPAGKRQGVPGHEARILAATLFVGCAWTDSPSPISGDLMGTRSRNSARVP